MFGEHADQRQDKRTNKILVTGSAGFIGFHVAKRLLREGNQVMGLDNLNAYYDVNLKHARLALLTPHRGFRFVTADVADRTQMERLFQEEPFDYVIHLAAQAGVRYSLTNPHAYVQSNVVGFTHVLEGCRHAHLKHLVFASSSSVYGANKQMPFSVHLANASYRLRRTLRFDAETEQVIEDDEAERLLRDGDRMYRAPFRVPEEI